MTRASHDSEPVYLDYAAATPVDARVLDAMLPYFTHHFGNSGSRMHGRGLTAEAAVEAARQQLSALLGARPVELLFTGGATESNNLALAGVAAAWNDDCHLVISATEHPSVVETAEQLVARGARLSVLPVRPDGRVDPRRLALVLESLADEERVLVSIMHANNETGVLNPVAEIGAVCRQHGALFHCDASQSVGKVPVDVNVIGADLLSLSAHKFYGPKGVGALYVRRRKPRVPIVALSHGGEQERGLRSGTLNVPGIVGLGAAAELAAESLAAESVELSRLTELMLACLRERLDGVDLNSSPDHRLPGLLNLSFEGVSAERLQRAIRPVAEISTGSACATGKSGPSPGLTALGLPAARAAGAVRIALGRFTTEHEVHRAMDAIVPAVGRIRCPSSRGSEAVVVRGERRGGAPYLAEAGA